MSSNVLEMIINDQTAGEVWWEKNPDGASRIVMAQRIKGDESPEEICKLLKAEWELAVERAKNPATDKWLDAYQIYRTDTLEEISLVLAQKKIALPPLPKEIIKFIGKVREEAGVVWNSGGFTTTGKLWLQLTWENSRIDLGNGDIAEKRLLIYYDYKSRKGRIKLCVGNVVCENTLIFSLSETGRSVDIDFGSLSDSCLDEIKSKFGLMETKYTQTLETFQTLQTREVDLRNGAEISTFAVIMDDRNLLDKILYKQAEKEEQIQIVSDLLSAHSQARTMEMSKVGADILKCIIGGVGQDIRGDNWYSAVQGVTNYVDHFASRTPDTRVESAYFGRGVEMKAEALQIASLLAASQLH